MDHTKLLDALLGRRVPLSLVWTQEQVADRTSLEAKACRAKTFDDVGKGKR
jgi:hypothetical protein